MPIYGNTLKNFLLQNHWADCLETWCVASGELLLKVYTNDDPGLTLTSFMAFEFKSRKLHFCRACLRHGAI